MNDNLNEKNNLFDNNENSNEYNIPKNENNDDLGSSEFDSATPNNENIENAEPKEQKVNENAKWYVLHTYTGYETIVRDNLETVFKKNGQLDKLYDICIPMEEVVEEKKSKRRLIKRKMFPCYVLVKMDYSDNMWQMITKTRGVTGFVGPQGRALPLTEDEIRKMGLENILYETDLSIGDNVKVLTGAMEGIVGEIDSLDIPRGKAKIMVNMFGKLTPMEIDLYQIEKIN